MPGTPGISSKTKYELAPNAAVEAARAGEQGRGFAVVASEVGTLPQRSAAAARESKILITESVGKAGDGTLLVGQAGDAMGEIVASVHWVSQLTTDIASASVEQARAQSQIVSVFTLA